MTTLRCLPLVAVLAIAATPGTAAAAFAPDGQLGAAALLSAPAQMRAMVRERAAQGSGNRRPAVRPVFRLKTGSGYEVEVVGVRDNVVIYVLPGSHAKSITAYVARGTVTAGRVAAGFGKFGKVSMRFRASGQRASADPDRSCKGVGRIERRPGTFVGEFRFRGEGGYVSVQARRAKGQVDSVAPRCRRSRSAQRVTLATHPSQNGFWGPEQPYLVSDWRHGVDSAHFAAVGAGKKTIFIATTEQAHGKFAIFRLALLAASSPKVLKVSNALTSARVSPPAPFSGSGKYRAAPDGTVSWTGPLAVDFPGAPHYPLTGSPFEALVGTSSEPFFAFF